jgi:hypothetical protein
MAWFCGLEHPSKRRLAVNEHTTVAAVLAVMGNAPDVVQRRIMATCMEDNPNMPTPIQLILKFHSTEAKVRSRRPLRPNN